MKFGLIYPVHGHYVEPKLVADSAVAAERHGFEFFLVWDHFMLPWSNRTFDAWTLLAFVAGKTSTIRIGTCVTPIPFRPPGLLAKMVATVDQLSEGRVVLGVGAGWHKPEFMGFSTWDDGPTRVRKTREGLELMRRLWTQDTVTFTGRFYQANGAMLDPKPVQKPHPPLWFGTQGDVMLKLAAKWGAGWIPVNISAHEFRHRGDLLRGYLRQYDRAAGFRFIIDAETEKDERAYVHAIEESRQAGADTYAPAWEYAPGEFVDRLSWFARNVMPSFT